MQKIQAASGQGWARAAVAVGAVLSVAGNATETVLTDSPVHLAIRIVIATFLPVIVFIAVEVFVRVAWRTMWLDRFGRGVLLLFPALGAAYVSFGHLYSLSRLSGSDEIAASANALAIDGLMIGGTVALLAIRAARLAETEQPRLLAPEEAAEPTPTDLAEITEKFTRATTGNGKLERFVTPVSPAGPRAPRSAKAEQEKAVRMLLDGATVEEAAAASGVSTATLRLYSKAQRLLLADPTAEIGPKLDGRSINAALLDIIRAWANREGRVL